MASTSVFSLTRYTALAAGDVLPAVQISDHTQSAHGSLNSITVTSFFASVPVPIIVTSASAGALAVGLTGATNPAFSVDASTALQVAGLNVKGAVTGGTVALVVTDSGSNANLTINAKGSGTIGIGSVSTGAVTITPNTTISGLLGVGGAPNQNAPVGDVPSIECISVSGTHRILAVTSYSDTSVFHFNAAAGTIGTPTFTPSGSNIMSIGARAYDGTGFNGSSLAIQGVTDESANGVTTPGAYMTFETSANGANQRTVTMFLDQSKYVGIGLFSSGTRPATPLHVLNTHTPQVTVAYDASHTYTESVASNGNVTINATGSINFTPAVTLNGKTTLVPSAATFDATAAGPQALLNNATGTLGTTADGFMFIADHSGDNVALVLLTAGTTVLIVSQSAGNIFTITQGSANKINVYYSAGTLTIENKSGLTKTITSFLVTM